MDDMKKCEPEVADSFQFQISVRDLHLNELLAASGVNRVFLRPRVEQSKTDPRFAVVWATSKLEAEKALVRITNHKGLVMNNKGYGVRMLATDIKQAHDILKPNQQFVDHLPVLYTYKLSPLPRGTTEKAIKDISDQVHWKFKPLKRLGDQAWLIGTSTKACVQFLSVEGCPVLVQSMNGPSKESKPSVIAGNLSKSGPTKKDDELNKDPWLNFDPWSKSKPSSDASSQRTTASIAGPTQTILDDFNTRIEKIEAGMQGIQQQHQQMSNNVEQRFEQTNRQIQKVETNMQHDLKRLSKEFTDTLSDSMKKQDRQLATQFSELKDLFRKSTEKRKTPATPEKEDQEL